LAALTSIPRPKPSSTSCVANTPRSPDVVHPWSCPPSCSPIQEPAATAAFALGALQATPRTSQASCPSDRDHDYLNHIGLRLRVLRTAQRLSQDQLADLAGLDRTYVSRLERGQHNVTVLVLERLARRWR